VSLTRHRTPGCAARQGARTWRRCRARPCAPGAPAARPPARCPRAPPCPCPARPPARARPRPRPPGRTCAACRPQARSSAPRRKPVLARPRQAHSASWDARAASTRRACMRLARGEDMVRCGTARHPRLCSIKRDEGASSYPEAARPHVTLPDSVAGLHSHGGKKGASAHSSHAGRARALFVVWTALHE